MDVAWINDLSEPIRTILFGAAAEFSGGLAAAFAKATLGKSYAAAKRLVEGSPGEESPGAVDRAGPLRDGPRNGGERG